MATSAQDYQEGRALGRQEETPKKGTQSDVKSHPKPEIQQKAILKAFEEQEQDNYDDDCDDGDGKL